MITREVTSSLLFHIHLPRHHVAAPTTSPHSTQLHYPHKRPLTPKKPSLLSPNHHHQPPSEQPECVTPADLHLVIPQKPPTILEKFDTDFSKMRDLTTKAQRLDKENRARRGTQKYHIHGIAIASKFYTRKELEFQRDVLWPIIREIAVLLQGLVEQMKELKTGYPGYGGKTFKWKGVQVGIYEVALRMDRCVYTRAQTRGWKVVEKQEGRERCRGIGE